jgi:hypothetical protein
MDCATDLRKISDIYESLENRNSMEEVNVEVGILNRCYE